MNNPAKTRNFFRLMIVLAVFLTTAGMLSCNNSAPAEEKKADTPTADTALKISVDTTKQMSVDTPKIVVDTTGKKPKKDTSHGKETKVPPPPPPKN